MNRTRFAPLLMAICSAVILGFAPLSHAQSFWNNHLKKNVVELEVLKADIDETSFLTSTLFFSLQYALSENLVLRGELPVTHVGFDGAFGETESESTIGNPYFGLEIHGKTSPVFLELGIRAPVAPNLDEDNGSATFTGLYTDFFDRAEAFGPDIVPISALVNYHREIPSGAGVRFRVGPVLWMNTHEGGDNEWWLVYGIQTWYDTSLLRIGGGLTGRALMSESGSFNERTIHQVGVSVDVLQGRLRPGAFVRVPLDDDWREVVNAVFGLKFGIQL